jgi:adhesin transport system membrane fusion protein
MRADRIIDLRDVSEFRQTLAARPPGIVHGTVLLLVCLVAAAIAWALLTEGNVVVRAAARVRPADAPLRGFDELSNEHVHAEAPGRIVEIAVKEGQHVERGAVLLKLDTTRVANEIERAKSEVAAIEAELRAIEQTIDLAAAQREAMEKRGSAEVRRSKHSVSRSRQRRGADQRLAMVELDEATRELSRARELVAQKAGPAADVAIAAARVDRAKARLAASRISVDADEPEVLEHSLEQAARDHEVKVAELARQRAVKQGALIAAQKQLANLELERDHGTLVAHRPGIVTLGGLAQGDVIAVGKLSLAITEQGKLRVDAAISTGDVAPLRIGMHVRVKLAALDYQRYGTAHGVITHIAADTILTADARPYYLISVALDRDEIGRGDLRGRLKPGMTGELEVITRTEPLLLLFADKLRGAISL